MLPACPDGGAGSKPELTPSSLYPEPPVQFLAPEAAPGPLCVAPGQPVVLSCELSRAGAPVFWSHNGKPVQEGEGLELHAEGPRRALCIRAAGPAHAGLYACQTGVAPGTPSLSFTVQVTGEYSLGRKPKSAPQPLSFPGPLERLVHSSSHLSQYLSPLASHCPLYCP